METYKDSTQVSKSSLKKKIQGFGGFFKWHGNAQYRSLYSLGFNNGIIY
ncbi:hypothetical protein DFN09_004331 [Clostridium acetobutylicum]|nr:hypothetical protein [Clostridium acetobutylicum]